MTTTNLKLSDQNVMIVFFSINLILAGFIGYFDEGFNSFQFLLDIGSVMTVLVIAVLLASLPITVYLLCILFKLKQVIGFGLSILIQSLIVLFIIIIL